MNQTKLELQYEIKSQKALEHHLNVLRIAMNLPADEFEEFYWQERETYNKVQEALLLELEQELKGVE